MKQMSERRKRRTEKILYRNRKAKVIIYNRIFLTALAMLLQIALFTGALVLLYSGNSYFATLLLFTTNLVGFALILHILNRNDRPSDKLNWIIVILVLPVFGVPMFFLYGDGRPTKKMERKIREQRRKNVSLLPPPPAADTIRRKTPIRKAANRLRTGKFARSAERATAFRNTLPVLLLPPPLSTEKQSTFLPAGKRSTRLWKRCAALKNSFLRNTLSSRPERPGLRF